MGEACLRLEEPVERPEWLKRPFSEGDADPLYYMLGVTYTRSRAGKRAGASRAGSSHGRAPDHEEVARQKAFMAVHRPIWSWLFEHADVTIACDPESPHIIWGWLITSGETVLHAVGCKRSFCERGPSGPLAIDLVTDMLGERLRRHQVCTLELPQMRQSGSGTIGLDRPQEWSLDPTWLVTRMVGR